jgi:hypothetical protein
MFSNKKPTPWRDTNPALLFLRRMRWPLCHAARVRYSKNVSYGANVQIHNIPSIRTRVARFFLVQHTKTGKIYPNYLKLYQMAINFTKWQRKRPNGLKNYKYVPFIARPNRDFWFENIGMYHLATLIRTTYVWSSFRSLLRWRSRRFFRRNRLGLCSCDLRCRFSGVKFSDIFF